MLAKGEPNALFELIFIKFYVLTEQAERNFTPHVYFSCPHEIDEAKSYLMYRPLAHMVADQIKRQLTQANVFVPSAPIWTACQQWHSGLYST